MSRAENLLAHWRYEAMRPYRRRSDSGYCQLNDALFDLLNDGGPDLELMTTGCLDALDELPLGGAKASEGERTAYWPYIWAARDWLTPEERQRRHNLAEQIIAEIRAEEVAARAENRT